MTWPDHKAPNTARSLLELVRIVNTQRVDASSGKTRGPVVVHCSAGIGRSGCFIATAIATEQARRDQAVDILQVVCQMRLDRFAPRTEVL